MIIIPIEKSLRMAQRIKGSNPTKKQIKRANDALFIGKKHLENMYRPAITALQPWSSPLPLDLNVPLLPYI